MNLHEIKLSIIQVLSIQFVDQRINWSMELHNLVISQYRIHETLTIINNMIQKTSGGAAKVHI